MMPQPQKKMVADQPAPRRLLTRAEVAEILQVSCATLSRWAADRVGPAWTKLGDGDTAPVRYPADLLDEFIASRVKSPKA